MAIKRFNEVICIISSQKPSVSQLNNVQHEINQIIHYNLYNFMLPKKVKEMIDALTPLFVKMAALKGLSPKVEDKRNELLQQGREIITKLLPYARSDYTIEEYAEVYQMQFNREVAQYLKRKKDASNALSLEEAMRILSYAKQLQNEWNELLGDRTFKLKDHAFICMISELREYISNSL
jgi:hypothetical protein